MRNILKCSNILRGTLILFLTLFCLPAFCQEIILVPDVDTLALWGTCVAPSFYWNLSHVDSVTNHIVVHSPDLYLGEPPYAIIEHYDSAYFEVRDTLRLVEYKIRCIHHSSWYPIDSFIPADSILYVDNGQMELILYILHNNLPIDSAIMKFQCYHTGLGVKDDRIKQPLKPILMQNYPNPFNPTTTIKYQLSVTSSVKLRIFNHLGQDIITLKDGVEPAGIYTVDFNSDHIASGLYFYRIEAVSTSEPYGAFINIKKMIIVK
jgi:Secretion system C-terminal sorting domain